LITERLGWQPRHADLGGIIDNALAWEDALSRRNQL
jgi:UDP-glucose 4-epimerase